MINGVVVWQKRYKEGFCAVTNPQGFERQFLLLRGVSLADVWPVGVSCKMSPRYPKDIQLSDSLYGGSYPVVSARLKEALTEPLSVGKTEFLPVVIINHKGRVASDEYFVVNPLETIDCIDQVKSDVKWNNINPDVISSCKQLVLREDVIPAEVGFFRPKHMLATYLMRRQLADALVKNGFTGLYFVDPEKYRG
jgi:hypothetical protein